MVQKILDMGALFDHHYEERFQKSCLTRTSDCKDVEVADRSHPG
jgi:hypothetical protein